ncbi:CHRD domain-containing protein [Chitinophaga vietnamensis]|uniref:CHRD domain-containing protein n=1 Tax=Chitinophaga vietnamensis TaxID=2593957 RepID=UPI00191BF92A|nr:CHRD domain-containing protein [Chitinophaga vietnamensis]
MQSISIHRQFRRHAAAWLLATGMLFSACSKSNDYGGGSPSPSTYNLSASLNGAQEVPPTTSSATGTFSGSYDPASYKITFTLSWNGLTGPPTAMHIHGPAAAGSNAGVEVPITGFAAAASGSVTVTATVLTQAQGTDLIANKYYVNIHTAANPGGEIRGQISASK